MNKSVRKIRIISSTALNRVFGSLFAFTGVVYIFSDLISGLVMFIMAAILIPPILKLIEQKINFKLTRIIKLIIIFVGLIIFFATIDTTDQEQYQNILNLEETIDQEIEMQGDTTKENIEVNNTIFDIPILLEKEISYFIELFGKPVNDDSEPTIIAVELGTEEWIKTFEKSGYTLDVTYNINNGKIIEIFLSKGTYNTPVEETWFSIDEIDSLLQKGNISKNQDNYYYRFMRSIQNKDKYTGITIRSYPFTGYEGNKLCNGYPEC